MTVGAAAWRARASALAPLAPLAVPLAVLAAGVGVPLAYLVLRAVAADPAALWALVARPRTLRLVGHTLALAGGVLGAATAVAAPLAWISARGGGRWTAVAGVLPLAVPGYVMAYALLGATGPAGLLADVGVALPRASGYAGALAALTLVTFPYLFLNLRAALAGLDPALEDAARALGLRPAEAVWRVVVPQLRPAYLAGALLVVLHVLGDFGVVSLMRFETFSYAIYLQYTAGYDRVYAAALALLLLSLTGIVLGAEAWLLRGVRLARTAPGAARRGARRLSPAGRVAGRVWAAAVALASVGLPLATMTYWLVRGGSGRAAAGDVLAALADSVTGSAPAAVLAAHAWSSGPPIWATPRRLWPSRWRSPWLRWRWRRGRTRRWGCWSWPTRCTSWPRRSDPCAAPCCRRRPRSTTLRAGWGARAPVPSCRSRCRSCAAAWPPAPRSSSCR